MLKLFLALVTLCFAGLGSNTLVEAETGNGTPFKYISSCEIDLNGDNVPDIAMLVETIRGRELIVLLKTKDGYDSRLLSSKVSSGMFMSSHFGDTLRGYDDQAKNKAIVAKTPGTCLVLHEPEGASLAFYWTGAEFRSIWIAD